MDLPTLKKKLYERLNFKDTNQEQIYQEEREKINNSFPDEGWRIPQAYIDAMKSLKNNKLKTIRTELNDDEGFNVMLNELDNVKSNITKKQGEIERLIPPNKPTFRQKLYTGVFGKTNSADSEINNFNERTKNIQDEISDLQKIAMDIETLIPIYSEPLRGGGKKKTRRNKKARKGGKARKSNRRH